MAMSNRVKYMAGILGDVFNIPEYEATVSNPMFHSQIRPYAPVLGTLGYDGPSQTSCNCLQIKFEHTTDELHSVLGAIYKREVQAHFRRLDERHWAGALVHLLPKALQDH